MDTKAGNDGSSVGTPLFRRLTSCLCPFPYWPACLYVIQNGYVRLDHIGSDILDRIGSDITSSRKKAKHRYKHLDHLLAIVDLLIGSQRDNKEMLHRFPKQKRRHPRKHPLLVNIKVSKLGI